MSDMNELVETYIAAWNETDPAARRALIDTVFAEDAEYTDPLVSVRGRDALDAVIAAAQGQFAGLTFSLGGAVDAHHHIARFTWHLGRPGAAEPVVIGFDVAALGDDGTIAQVLGFLDKVPAA
ncbi:nuclear transport factor 2 family protein [Actinomadura barringtoniae]|uniref:Nuclear transport factor 2 family protein n=1 Tax=Actinomadura barringtoniae TaxID=1427535 RepID=A0A939PGV2_9ACTN|nr:nuclear transport factor 2 family protein [Actinomadura barringtoniae]MBO2448969.1 nuclear transport factor 2 family protein [Actinomadura barringtoniae]